MKRKKLLIGGLLFLLCLCITPVYAANDIKYETVKTPKVERISGLKGSFYYDRSSIGNKELITTTDPKKIELDEKDWNYSEESDFDETTETDHYYYYDTNYNFHYSIDGKNYKSKSLNSILKEKLNMSTDKYHRFEIDTTYPFKDAFYIFVTETIYTSNIDEYGYDEPKITYNGYILKTTDGVNYTLIKAPDYHYVDMKILRYNDTFILAGTLDYYYSEGEKSVTYNYYTSDNLINWTKREINHKFTSYEPGVIQPSTIVSSGVIFGITDYWGSSTGEMITNDFKNYKVFDETAITAPNSDFTYIGCEWGSTESYCGDIKDEQKYIWKSVPGIRHWDSSDNNNTVRLKMAYSMLKPPQASRTRGIDFYITNPVGNKYEHLYGTNMDWDWYHYNYDSDPQKSAYFFLFLTAEDGTTKLIHSKNYLTKQFQEYNINISAEYMSSTYKINNKRFFIYNNEYLMILDSDLKSFKRVKLPEKASSLYFSDDGKYVIFPSVNGFMKMSLNDIYNAETINYTPGDINQDEKIDLTDVLMSLKMYFNDNSSMTENQKLAADLNGDGKVDLTDILMLLKAYFNK